MIDKLQEQKRLIYIGLIGAGTVGGGTLRVLADNAEVIALRSVALRVKRVVDLALTDTEKQLVSLGYEGVQLSDRWQDIVEDPQIDIVVELIGGIHPAKEMIQAALTAGKSVVTANKDLMAAHGYELLQLAYQHGCDLFFEASVGGGIPIIQAVQESFAGNTLNNIMGIVNGTTNYILTKMTEEGGDFAAVLKEAQDLGYAEANPASDIEGLDAARKMAILASIAYNSRVSDAMVSTEGISKITPWDILYASEFDCVIKMLGIARCDGKSIDVRVHPVMIHKTHPLASIRDSYNAIFVQGDMVENTMFYGRGAGALPTGSAIAGDIIAAASNIVYDCRARRRVVCYRDLPILPLAETISKYYLRMQVFDQVGVFAALAQCLGDNNVSMGSVVQKRRLSGQQAEIVIITHQVRHEDMMQALAAVNELPCVLEVSNIIRVEDEGIA